MTQEHYFLLMLAMIGFGGQIAAQIIISLFQWHTEKSMRQIMDQTHAIVNSQRTEMMEKIERLEILLRDKEALRTVLNSMK